MRYFCIGDEDTVLGFRLAGVKGRLARDSGETQAAFRSATAMPGIGIVIITERLAGLIREELDAFQAAAELPLILEVPDRHGPVPDRKSMEQIVWQAVGMKF